MVRTTREETGRGTIKTATTSSSLSSWRYVKYSITDRLRSERGFQFRWSHPFGEGADEVRAVERLETINEDPNPHRIWM